MKQIPKVWKQAYLIILGWYVVNVGVSTFTTFYLFNPSLEEFLHGLLVLVFYMIYIAVAWLWTNALFGQKITLQVVGQVAGVFMAFMSVSYLFFQLSIYFDNRTVDTFQEYLIESFSGTKTSGKMDAFRIYNEYGAVIFVAYVIRYAQYLKRREQEKAQLMVKNKDMQLNLLKSQINPHFLFNTLNSISMLVGASKEKARKMITRLSSVIRYTLETGEEQVVPLSSELVFIDDYVDIQHVRFEEHFELIKEIDPSCMDMAIPPMALQTLVENSIKYGVGQKDSGGKIWIKIQPADGYAIVEVLDNGLGKNAVQQIDKPSTGIGLKNTDTRLQGLFGKQAKLYIDAREDGFSVKFTIPIRKVS